MFKRATLALVMLGTLTVSSLVVASSADARRYRGGWYGRPAYYSNYYRAPSYRSYYTPRYSYGYGVPYRSYYGYGGYGYGAPYRYGARRGVQVYFR